MFKKTLIANRGFVIASEAKQSSSWPGILDCRVAQNAFGLLTMTGKGEAAHV
jgi:hypothetical protein